ncbi:unnamed protein product [Miscanthus lutarioriparius]|uniref:ASCH domain-containing protein n=1 Tax=Miscanthus lutarioriparius TaxID=422564 RepID=A0A811MN37_9POAL|nr:unnamed protein product [Miscanthus lutarioriparius]
MHQPWASLLVHGIKRVEGRSWPSPITGRLWIHAASKVPDPDTIKAMEDFYREIYAVNDITDIKFPDHYPVSRLLGCVEVVGCLRSDELVCWEHVPESVRLEGLTDFCWLCENPQKLVVPFEMRGYQGVYNLERRIYDDGAVRALFFHLFKVHCLSSSAVRAFSPVQGARAAATQFSKKDHKAATSSETGTQEQSWGSNGDSSSVDGNVPSIVHGGSAYLQNQNQPSIFQSTPAYSQNPNSEPRRSPRLEFGASNRLVTVALRELKQLSLSEKGAGQAVPRS